MKNRLETNTSSFFAEKGKRADGRGAAGLAGVAPCGVGGLPSETSHRSIFAAGPGPALPSQLPATCHSSFFRKNRNTAEEHISL